MELQTPIRRSVQIVPNAPVAVRHGNIGGGGGIVPRRLDFSHIDVEK